MFKRNPVPVWLGIMVLSGVLLMGTACSIPPDLALLVDFVADDDPLMVEFFIAEPDPGPGTDVTINGAIGGSCRWTISNPPFGQMPIVTYDYQDYNQSGLIVNGARSGEMSIDSIWIIHGTHLISGDGQGWIRYIFPFNAWGFPRLEDRTWNVCNYDDGCVNDPGDVTGLPTYTPRDVRQPWRIELP